MEGKEIKLIPLVRLLMIRPLYRRRRYKSMEKTTGRLVCVSGALTLVSFLAIFQAAQAYDAVLASSSSPWPYPQLYPPVNASDGRTPLYFALMLSFGGDYVTIGALPGVQIALDYINSQPSILPGYSLHYTLTDSQVWQDNNVYLFAS